MCIEPSRFSLFICSFDVYITLNSQTLYASVMRDAVTVDGDQLQSVPAVFVDYVCKSSRQASLEMWMDQSRLLVMLTEY